MLLTGRAPQLNEDKAPNLEDLVSVVRMNGGLFLKPRGNLLVETEPFTLSPREIDILKHVATGNSNKEIANLFDISENTVKNHMSSIMQKLRVKDRTHAVVTALRHGWISI